MKVILIIFCFVITSFAQAQICFINSICPRTNDRWDAWGIVPKTLVDGWYQGGICLKMYGRTLELSPFFDDKGNENNDDSWSCKIYLEKKTISQAQDKYGIYDKYDGTMIYYIDDDYQTLESQIATKSFPFVMRSRHNKDHRPCVNDKINVRVMHYKFEYPSDDVYFVFYKNTGFAFKVIKKGLVLRRFGNILSVESLQEDHNRKGILRQANRYSRTYILKEYAREEHARLGRKPFSIRRAKKFIDLIYDNLDKFYRIDEKIGWYPDNELYLENKDNKDFQAALWYLSRYK